MPPDPLLGQILAGRYRVVRAIGEGGMGAVYEAVQLDLDRTVAIKLLRKELAEDPKCVERFRREAITAAQLMHPNIPQILDFVPGPPLILAMELLSGTPLIDELTKGRMAPGRACAIAAQLASALATAHDRGIVHRDLKPGNVFLVPVAGGELAMLLDFGVAKLKESEGYTRLTVTGVMVGTPRYASPEQIMARPDIDGRSDVFSLGVLLYSMLSGRPPFMTSGAQLLVEIQTREPPELARAAPDLPPELVAIVERAMKKNPGERFSSMREMGAALEPFLVSASMTVPDGGAGFGGSTAVTQRDAVTGPMEELPIAQIELPDAPSVSYAVPATVPLPPPKKGTSGCLAFGIVGLVLFALLSGGMLCGLAWLGDEDDDAYVTSSDERLGLRIDRVRLYRWRDGDWTVRATITVTNRSSEPAYVPEIEADGFEPFGEEWAFPDPLTLDPGESMRGEVVFYCAGFLPHPSEIVIRAGTDAARAPLRPEPGSVLTLSDTALSDVHIEVRGGRFIDHLTGSTVRASVNVANRSTDAMTISHAQIRCTIDGEDGVPAVDQVGAMVLAPGAEAAIDLTWEFEEADHPDGATIQLGPHASHLDLTP